MFLENKNTKSVKDSVQNFLFKYRSTPSTSTGQTPFDRIFIYSPKTSLEILNEKSRGPNKSLLPPDSERKSVQTSSASNKKNRIYEKHDQVLYRTEGDVSVKWHKAKIIERLSEFRYKIETFNGNVRVCHGDQLRPFNKHFLYSQTPIRSWKSLERIRGKQ